MKSVTTIDDFLNLYSSVGDLKISYRNGIVRASFGDLYVEATTVKGCLEKIVKDEFIENTSSEMSIHVVDL